jgi:hypothetical protein
MTNQQLIAKVRRAIKKFDSQAAFAREIDIGCDELSNFLNGHRNPPARLLAYLGYKPITIYERI